MSIHVNYWEFESPEQCLEWLFDNNKAWINPDSLHIWTESFATLGGGNLCGGYKWVSRKMLEGRVYKVRWCNDSVGICFYDEIFVDKMVNRKYPDNTRCVLVRLPNPDI